MFDAKDLQSAKALMMAHEYHMIYSYERWSGDSFMCYNCNSENCYTQYGVVMARANAEEYLLDRCEREAADAFKRHNKDDEAIENHGKWFVVNNSNDNRPYIVFAPSIEYIKLRNAIKLAFEENYCNRGLPENEWYDIRLRFTHEEENDFTYYELTELPPKRPLE